MNIQRLNMYAGAVIGSLLFYMLVGFFADLIYIGPEHAGEEHEVLAFAVETGAEGEAAPAAETPEVDWAALVAAADPAAGEKLFKGKCASCHSVEPGVNKLGPTLHGVVGRPIASVEGFSYSPALAEHAGERWSLENLAAFLHNPKEFAPGTKMTFAGFKKPEEAVAVIVYLNEASGNPVPLVEEKKAALETPAPETTSEPAAQPEAQPETQPETGAAEQPAGQPATGQLAAPEPAAQPAAQPAPEPAAEPAGGTEAAASMTAPAEALSAAGEAAASAAESAAQAAGAVAGATAGTAAGAAEAVAEAAGNLLATADIELGKKVFNKCKACHSLEPGVNKLGPSLHGMVGRPVASVEGFNYSEAMKAKGGTWTVEALDAFLADPRGVVPGTKMTLSGLKKPEERAAVIAYIEAQSK